MSAPGSSTPAPSLRRAVVIASLLLLASPWPAPEPPPVRGRDALRWYLPRLGARESLRYRTPGLLVGYPVEGWSVVGAARTRWLGKREAQAAPQIHAPLRFDERDARTFETSWGLGTVVDLGEARVAWTSATWGTAPRYDGLIAEGELVGVLQAGPLSGPIAVPVELVRRPGGYDLRTGRAALIDLAQDDGGEQRLELKFELRLEPAS